MLSRSSPRLVMAGWRRYALVPFFQPRRGRRGSIRSPGYQAVFHLIVRRNTTGDLKPNRSIQSFFAILASFARGILLFLNANTSMKIDEEPFFSSKRLLGSPKWNVGCLWVKNRDVRARKVELPVSLMERIVCFFRFRLVWRGGEV